MQKGKIKPTASFEKRAIVVVCLRHTGQELKYFCEPCSALVCPECLLFGHKDHRFSMIEEACHSLEIKMEELAGLVVEKKE